MTVRTELENRTGQPVSLGAVYTTLERLEGKGYLTSRSTAGGA
jgi:DNA-binding PadR family transcriptional regulator